MHKKHLLNDCNISSVGFNSFASVTALANVLTPLDAFAPFVIWPTLFSALSPNIVVAICVNP